MHLGMFDLDKFRCLISLCVCPCLLKVPNKTNSLAYYAIEYIKVVKSFKEQIRGCKILDSLLHWVLDLSGDLFPSHNSGLKDV